MNGLINLDIAGLTADGIPALESLIVYEHPTVPNINCPALTDVADLRIFGNPLLTNVSLPTLRSYTGSSAFQLNIKSNPLLASVSLSALVFSMSAITISRNDSLTSLQLDALVHCQQGFGVSLNPLLTTLNLPSLVLASAYSAFFGFQANDCVALTTVNFPKYLPTSGRKQDFRNCALTEASVDHVLARCVASKNYVAGTIDLSGGTNATPGTQGQIDKATLIARGCVVLTN